MTRSSSSREQLGANSGRVDVGKKFQLITSKISLVDWRSFDLSNPFFLCCASVLAGPSVYSASPYERPTRLD